MTSKVRIFDYPGQDALVLGTRRPDGIDLDRPASFVLLGKGADTFTGTDITETLYAGRGHDTVELSGDAGFLTLGRGRDHVTIEGYADKINGGRGRDTVDFGDRELGNFDIRVEDRALVFSDPITGREMTILNVETFQFANDTYSLREIEALYGAGNADPVVNVLNGTQQVAVNNTDPSISVIWDRVVQEAVIEAGGGPTVAARAYAMMHTAIYDAWASYDATALRVSMDVDGDNAGLSAAARGGTDADIEKAMSYAATTVLLDLFPGQERLVRSVMEDRLGHSIGDDGSVAAAVGLDAAGDLLALRDDDGSNQANGYAAPAGAYTPVNTTPDERADIAAWTPEFNPIDSGRNLQSFLTPHWADVESFALAEDAAGNTDHSAHRPAPPEPFFTADYADATLNLDAGTITHDGRTFDVDRSLIGDVINPAFIAQAEEVVDYSANLTEEQKLIAEFAEDGPGTSFPPGTFMCFAQYVAARDDNDLGDDALLFMAMGNAMLDAAVATWEAKVFYDYARPVRVIRDLGELGLIGEFDADLGGYAIDAWAGPGLGTQRILATEFISYQRVTGEPSPPFAEYTSGHSAFSAAGAEVLRSFTDSDDFGATFTFPPGSTQFETGLPTDTIVLEFETFSEAADANGLSRLYGGIHFTDGDVNGRDLGTQVGGQAFDLAVALASGTAGTSDLPFWTPEPDMV